MVLDRLVAVLARKLESQDEPGFVTRLTWLILALCVLLALCLMAVLLI